MSPARELRTFYGTISGKPADLRRSAPRPAGRIRPTPGGRSRGAAGPPLPGGAMEVKWGDLSPTVVEAAIGGKTDWNHKDIVTKSVFPLPARPMELWCEAPYTVNSDLPKGEKYKGPGDCGRVLAMPGMVAAEKRKT